MRKRADILTDLIYLNGNIVELQSELSKYSWDIETPILVMDKIVFSSVLQRCIDDKITFKEIEDWADAIECRDDLGFEDDKMKEVIFELSNPIINGAITKDRLEEIIKQLP